MQTLEQGEVMINTKENTVISPNFLMKTKSKVNKHTIEP